MEKWSTCFFTRLAPLEEDFRNLGIRSFGALRLSVNTDSSRMLSPDLPFQQRADELVSEAEREAKETIAQEKLAYKTSYQNLRELKSEIEQIQKLMERSRKKLQADFDAWYEQQGRGETLTKALLSSDGEKQVEFKPQFNEQPIKQAWASPTYSTATTQSTSSFASSEIRSTGYRDTDADIEAFYKASEILKARRSRS